MKTIIILIITLLAMIVSANALELCEGTPKISTDCAMVTPALTQCTTYNYSIFNTTGEEVSNGTLTLLNNDVYYFNFTLGKGEYLIRLCDGGVREIIVEGKDEMASLAVVIFVMLITIGVFALPRIVKNFSSNYYLDSTLKGLCILMGLFLLSLDTAMVATIASNADMGVTREILRYLWLVNWAAYIAMVIIVLGFGWKMLQAWDTQKKRKNMGEEDE